MIGLLVGAAMIPAHGPGDPAVVCTGPRLIDNPTVAALEFVEKIPRLLLNSRRGLQ